MIPFEYVRAASPKSAVDALNKNSGARIIAGGTNLVDLMKRQVVMPTRLVDINKLALNTVTKAADGITIGALALNSAVAENKLINLNLPLLSQALLSGASAQLRNMATTGGNLLQRTRCPYFYDVALPCNKREPGSGCSAIDGFNRMHAIFGFSEKCIAVNPSDMNVAMAALDARINVTGPAGNRQIPIAEFHRLPGDTPEIDTNLKSNELITSVFIPAGAFQKKVHYLKLRDRSSYAFALVSVAAGLSLKNNTISQVRLAMGGVAHKPWRLYDAEKFLTGKQATPANFKEAATIALNGAKGFQYNAFKLKLAPLAIVQALQTAVSA